MEQGEHSQGGAEYQDPQQKKPQKSNQPPRRSGLKSGHHHQGDHPYRRNEDAENPRVARRRMKNKENVKSSEHRPSSASNPSIKVESGDTPVDRNKPSTSGKPFEGCRYQIVRIKTEAFKTGFPDFTGGPFERHQDEPIPQHSTGAIPKRKHACPQIDSLTRSLQAVPASCGLGPSIQIKEVSVVSLSEIKSHTDSPLDKRHKLKSKGTAEVAPELGKSHSSEFTLSQEIETNADIAGAKTESCDDKQAGTGIERRIRNSEKNRGFVLGSDNEFMRWTTTHVIIYPPNAYAPNFRLTPNDNQEKWAMKPLKKSQHGGGAALCSKQDVQPDVSADSDSDEELLGRPSKKGTSNRVYGFVPHLGNIVNSCMMYEPTEFCNLFTTCSNCGTPQGLFARVPMHLVVQWSKKIGGKSHCFRKEYEVLFPVDAKVFAVMLQAERPDVKEWLLNSKVINLHKMTETQEEIKTQTTPV